VKQMQTEPCVFRVGTCDPVNDHLVSNAPSVIPEKPFAIADGISSAPTGKAGVDKIEFSWADGGCAAAEAF
jgi:hypothetical protein